MPAWIRLLRPGDWTKNVFVLLPAVFWLSGQGKGLAEADVWAKVWPLLEAFGCFCLAASGSYCVNDALDAAKDRLHPVKRRRPVASGAIDAGVAVVAGLALQMAAVVAGFLLVSRVVGACLLVYLVLQALYNVRLKRVPLVDVSVLATGFCLRAAGGAAAIQVQMSVWLLLCVFFLTLFLGFTKRLCDLAAAENARAAGEQVDWKPRIGYESRDQMNWLLGVSGALVVMLYLSYTLSPHADRLYGARAVGLSLLTPLALVAIHRFYRRANLGLSDAPLETLRTDRVLLFTIAAFSVGTLACLQSSAVESLLNGLLVR